MEGLKEIVDDENHIYLTFDSHENATKGGLKALAAAIESAGPSGGIQTPSGLGYLTANLSGQGGVDIEDLRETLKGGEIYVDYYKGRCVKVQLEIIGSKASLSKWLYDREWGKGALLRVIEGVK